MRHHARSGRHRLNPVELAFLGEDPSRRHVVSTAIAALLAISAGTQAASSIYSSKKQADLNEKSIAAQKESDAANRAAQLTAQANDLAAAKEKQAADLAMSQKQLDASTSGHTQDITAAATAQGASYAEAERARQEDIAYKEKARQDALALDKARYDAYVAANQPSWTASAGILTSLSDLAKRGLSPTASATSPMGASDTPAAALARAGSTGLGAAMAATPLGASTPASTASAPAGTSLLSLARAASSVAPAAPTAATAPRTTIASAPIATPKIQASGPMGMSLMDYIKQVLAQPGGSQVLSKMPAPSPGAG